MHTGHLEDHIKMQFDTSFSNDEPNNVDSNNSNKHNVDLDQSDELIGHMSEFERCYDEMVLLESESNLDLTKLNNERHCNLQPETGFYSKYSSVEIKLASLEDSFEVTDDVVSTVETSSKELISYFAQLGKSENTDDIDYSFLDTLLSRADINSKDIHGQTVMHEVAREWSTDLAYFFKVKGINIDIEDNWGRTALFVAAASNYTEMVSWLIKNGANINHRTIYGERQTPLHYAAKYDAVEAFKILMEKGANILEKDAHHRDPFFLAALVGNIRICRYMLELELPTACYANSGEATIDHIVENLPIELAERALDQFIGVDRVTGNIKLYLSCLRKRRWKLLSNCRNSVTLLASATPPTPLEIVTRRGILKLINHPVLVKLIQLKYDKVGIRFIQVNIVLHLIFTILWTCSAAIRMPEHIHGVTTEHNVVLALTLFSQPLTFLFIYKFIREYTSLRQLIEDEKKRLLHQYEKSKVFCHPRWRMDVIMLNKIKDKGENMRTEFWGNGWTIIESLCLLMACVNTMITIVWYIYTSMEEETVLPRVRMYYSAIFVVIIWVRLNRCFRSHRLMGPFSAMLAECAICSAKIAFLFFEFFIPFSVTCWVIFGGNLKLHKSANQTSGEYETFNSLLYQIYLLAFVGDYDYDTLKEIKSTASQIFVGVYIVFLSIITINIYIALLSEAVARINATSTERACLEESDSCGKVERTFPELKREFDVYLSKYCSPMEIHISDISQDYTVNARKILSEASTIVMALSESVHEIIQEQKRAKEDLVHVEKELQRFRAKYGKEHIEKTLKKVSSVMEFQVHPLVKIAKKTDDRIMKYVNKVKQN